MKFYTVVVDATNVQGVPKKLATITNHH